MFGTYAPRQGHAKWLFVVTETLLLGCAIIAAAVVRFGTEAALADEFSWPKLLVGVFGLQLFLYLGELYGARPIRSRIEFLLRLGLAFVGGAVLLSQISYALPTLKFGRGVLLLSVAFACVAILVWRTVSNWASAADAFQARVLILGAGVTAQQVAHATRERAPLDYRVVGFLGEHPDEVGRGRTGPPVLDTIDNIDDVVPRLSVTHIVTALEDRRGKLPMKELLNCRMDGIVIEPAATFYERISGKILLTSLHPSALVFGGGFQRRRLVASAKETLEPALALLLLVLLSPLLAALVLAIRLEGRGPAIYRQERVGRNGKPLQLLKLRTMTVDSEAKTGPVWASHGSDPRVTRLGYFLRKSRLDELPQLVNVLHGRMSFVGPRPERPHFVDKLAGLLPYYQERHRVRPGITGWAQINIGYGSSIESAEAKLQYDLYYVKKMSPMFDLLIAVRTFKTLLFSRGAR